MISQNLSSRMLIKKVDYLLSKVNLSFDLLNKFKKGTIYRLLKKAIKVNSDFDLNKNELKEIAKIIADWKPLKNKKIVRVYKQFLKIKNTWKNDRKDFYHILSYKVFILVQKFLDKNSIIRI